MIHVEGLTKYYGSHAAIRDLAFRIGRGEVIGFLGLNGAGKTTTLKILGCVLLPTSGRAIIDGYDVVSHPHEVRQRIGFLPDTPPLYDEMGVGEFLAFVARLRGVGSRDVFARVAEAEEKTGLCDVDDAPISSLSHGYRQRVGVAQALVHRPALLILDEPGSGLDPRQMVEMRALIRGLRGEHTVLVSSHLLSEISQTCDRLLVIKEGELVAQGTEEELSQRLGGGGFIEVEVRGERERVLAVLAGVGPVRVTGEAEGVVTLRVDAPVDLRPRVAQVVVSAGLELLRLDRGVEKLESLFLRLTHGGEGRAP
ncbi:ABC transporter ATP-binding protein [Vitiosangium sp. GDMCC 1.1324]|uniref:ABC transporter ATP-binding protein n=1 Tax=Vitiosangium sp. (strain GDMCC 1.1324) TaxID=2138576 RepID=UPI000D37BB86|nr:ABC transporter ATP-binding protein [Vitiosangium sp. GDMCC 1.1324]PTL79373.1 ABC transporter ATP-binding protein [Vitiosangium sp. GDMCC 1.1324]